MTAQEMYWITRMDWLLIVWIALFFMFASIANVNEDKTRSRACFIVALIALIAFFLTPSTKDMKEIYGIEQSQTGGGK